MRKYCKDCGLRTEIEMESCPRCASSLHIDRRTDEEVRAQMIGEMYAIATVLAVGLSLVVVAFL